MLELEKKVLLTKDEYETLLNLLGISCPFVKQTNYYFDTKTFSMNRKGITCRIRLKNGKYTATIKKHAAYAADGSIETSVSVKNGIEDNGFLDMGLYLCGSLTTQRTVILKDTACEMVLDRNDYLGYTDYELEIEYLTGYDERAVQHLQKIALVLMSVGKIKNTQEFFSRIGKSGNKSQRFFEKASTQN